MKAPRQKMAGSFVVKRKFACCKYSATVFVSAKKKDADNASLQ